MDRQPNGSSQVPTNGYQRSPAVPQANGQQHQANGRVPPVEDLSEGGNFADGVAANDNDNRAQQVASARRPAFPPHPPRQVHFDPVPPQLILGSSPATLQPGDTRAIPQDHEWWNRIRRDVVETTFLSPDISPRTVPTALHRHAEHAPALHPPFNTGVQPRGVRRDASHLETSHDTPQFSTPAHRGITGVSGHYSRAAPRSSFTYAGNVPQRSPTPGPNSVPHHFSRELPDFRSDATFSVVDWEGTSLMRGGGDALQGNGDSGPANWVSQFHGQMSDSTPQGNGDPSAPLWTSQFNEQMPNFNDVSGPFSNAQDSSGYGMQQQQFNGNAPHWTPRTSSPYGTPTVFPPHGTVQYQYGSAHDQDGLGGPQRTMQQQTAPTTYQPMNPFEANGHRFSGGIRTMEPRYTPGLMPSSPRGFMPPAAPNRPRSNSMQHTLNGHGPDTFVSPYTMGFNFRSPTANMLPTTTSGPTGSVQGSSHMHPYGYSSNQQHNGNAAPESSHPRSEPTFAPSTFPSFEQQGHPGFNVQGQPSSSVSGHVVPASRQPTPRPSFNPLTSGVVHYEDAPMGDVLSTQPEGPPSNTDARFVSNIEYHQDPSLIFHDPNSLQPKKPAEQRIVTTYEDYHAAVTLYEIVPKKAGCDHAQAWLDDATHARRPSAADFPLPSVSRTFLHFSQGFIPSGTPLSLVVLHNATNPFSAHPISAANAGTSTVGVYGYHWYSHDWIHWTTFTPSLQAWFELMEGGGYVKEVKTWEGDMRASERRFHRAYWLAANRLPLRNLLCRAPVADAADPEAVEDEAGFALTENDLTDECGPVSAEDARDAGDVVMGVAERAEEVSIDHIVLGDPEAPLYERLKRKE